jgi:hypothetical protein
LLTRSAGAVSLNSLDNFKIGRLEIEIFGASED